MASTDSVAIDTVETALAGFEYDGVELLKIAAENGLGVNDPAHIRVGGALGVTNLKRLLLKKYGESGNYPPTAHGTGKPQKEILPDYAVLVEETMLKPDAQNVCHIRYHIIPAKPDSVQDIRRVELLLLSSSYAVKTAGDLLNGSFDVPQSVCESIDGAYMPGLVLAWDGMFNCVASALEFFIPPKDCED